MSRNPEPATAPASAADAPARTTYCVWEITLRCNLSCTHCGSRAGKARAQELDTREALDVVRQLAEVGIREVTLIGGEAFLRPDWLQIAQAITDHGMRVGMVTGGFGISKAIAERMREAGFRMASVSVDGLSATHDALRGRIGSFSQCFVSLANLRAAGIDLACNTQVNRLTAPELPVLYSRLRQAGVKGWQLGLTVPMGRAAERPEILMQPAELIELFELVACLARQAALDSVSLQPGNNFGYYGPYEELLRTPLGQQSFWRGCLAGVNGLGIEADGTVKGCPSLPTAGYAGGNLRDHRLADLLADSPELNLNRAAVGPGARARLWGFCAGCDFAELCRGGCTWTAHVFFGRPGNNVYCHHRALVQARSGVRERVVRELAAPGRPFDHGRFAIVEEPLDARWPDDDALRFCLEKVQWPDDFGSTPRPCAPVIRRDPSSKQGTRIQRPPPAPPLEPPREPRVPSMQGRSAFASELDRSLSLLSTLSLLEARRPASDG